jgi:heterodisulfide reductase subunit A
MVEVESEVQASVFPEAKVGAIMVVGAGVSGIQAALDLANSGFRVYLVDEAPAIGGKMAQLDKTFPTNDCSMCILSPKFIECARNPNISIITNAQVESVSGEAGNFEVALLKKPRYVDEEKCTGCGTCFDYCPVNILDAYNENLASTKCIYMPFPQAVPTVAAIDPNHCLFLIRRECKACAPTCSLKAINLYQQPERLEINVGSIVLALGYEPFDPRSQSEYGYKKFSNVVTSLEFERILSASGPYQGELRRPSDGEIPKKIAWVQCVGSRDITSGNNYCSAVCCMYAVKQSILAKERGSELQATIFHNDVRAFGKGFERYYERAKKDLGVKFIWSKVSIVREVPETKNLVIRYRLSGTKMNEEEFDLVVLSVGLTSPPARQQMANSLSIKLNNYGFCQSNAFSPIETSRPGIYACGVFHAPMDIPDSVTMASGAAALSSQLLSECRGTLVKEKIYPSERNVHGEPPRIGVFICRCGTNIAKTVDVPRLVRYAGGLDNVVHVEETLFACSIDATNHMRETIMEKGLNRVVVAACTPRTHEVVFQETLREAGLNPYLFEMANIREQCAWVHASDEDAATRKAQDLVRMAISKARLFEPLKQLSTSINRSALVIGGGISGMESALGLARQGFEVHLVEQSEVLGGIARRISHTLEGGDVQVYLSDLVRRVGQNNLIHVYTEANVVETSGFVGNFSTKIAVRQEKIVKEILHGVTIVATGGAEYKPTEYLYGKDPKVLTLLEMEEQITHGNPQMANAGTLVMILCVGSRDSERPYCSRVCCGQAIKNALKLKEINPEVEIYVLYRDMRTYGLMEDYYQQAADREVKFIRYDVDSKPNVEIIEEGSRSILRVSVTDPMLGKQLMLDADLLVLAAATVAPTGNRELSQLLKVPLNEDGFFMEAHMKLRPVDFAGDGIFMCGLAHSPKSIDESIAQAQAAVSRATSVLVKDTIMAEGAVCWVDEAICSGCGNCERTCPYQAIRVDLQDKVARVNEAICKGCGVCCVACPSGVAQLRGFKREQISDMIVAALEV